MNYHALDRCTGPACPRCGCQDAQILAQPDPSQSTWYGAGRAKCRHCAMVYHFKEVAPAASEASSPSTPTTAPAKVIPIVACQNCGAEMRVASSPGKVRHYRCPACGATDKRSKKS